MAYFFIGLFKVPDDYVDFLKQVHTVWRKNGSFIKSKARSLLNLNHADSSLLLFYYTINGWCASHNPSSVLGDIQLNGLPASLTEIHRRLFALSPRRTAVSSFPQYLTQRLSTRHRHWYCGRFISVLEPRF